MVSEFPLFGVFINSLQIESMNTDLQCLKQGMIDRGITKEILKISDANGMADILRENRTRFTS